MSTVQTRDFILLPTTTNTATAVYTTVPGSVERWLGVVEKDAVNTGITEINALPQNAAVRITPLGTSAATSFTLGIFDRRFNPITRAYVFARLGTFTCTVSAVDAGQGSSLLHTTVAVATDEFGASGAYRIVGTGGQQSIEIDGRGADGILLMVQTVGGSVACGYSFIALPT